MRTIVAPVNFSAASNNAARYAADMALSIQADLHLVHVLQVPISTAEMPMTDDLFEEMQSIAAEGLKELWDELIGRTSAKLNIIIHLEIGSVESRLQRFCKRTRPFAVIMSVAGGALERILVGDNTARTLRQLPYPLIVVPEHAVFHAIKKIILACDLDDLAGGIPVSPSFLQELKDIFHASLEVININTGKQSTREQTVFETEAWKERFQEFFPEVHFVDMDTVESGVDRYLSSHEAELLLVFPKDHHFFEFHKSQAKKIALNSAVPVMSIPA